MTLSIILLTYNSEDTVIKCLESFLQFFKDEFESERFELIVVDNSSSDSTVKKVQDFSQKEKNLKIKVIKNSTNLGFAGGINVASKNASGKYLLFQNPDTEILDANLKRALLLMDEDNKVGVVGGRLIGVGGKVEKSVGKDFGPLHILSLSLGIDNFTGVRSAPNSIKSVDWVSGASMIVRRSTFVNVNGFDESYFMYVEDADLCKRIRRVGQKVIYLPEFQSYHEMHASSNKSFAITNIYKGIGIYTKKFCNPVAVNLIQLQLRAKANLIIGIATVFGLKNLKSTYKSAKREL